MYSHLEAAQCTQSSSFSHQATHLNNTGFKYLTQGLQQTMVFEDEDRILYLILNLGLVDYREYTCGHLLQTLFQLMLPIFKDIMLFRDFPFL